jgi:hypothetical protein
VEVCEATCIAVDVLALFSFRSELISPEKQKSFLEVEKGKGV